MYNLLIYLITCVSVLIVSCKVEHISCLFNCYYIRYILNTEMRTGRYSFVKLKFCKLCVCCAVESVFMNLSVQYLDRLSSAILIPVLQPLMICSEESG